MTTADIPSQSERSEYWLSLLKSESDSSTTIDALISLEEEVYKKYSEVISGILRLQSTFETFNMVARNHQQLTSLRSYYENLFGAPKGKGRVDLRSAGVGIATATINWLTTVRLFLDHEETRLKRRYGHKSPQVERFKSACSEAFDSSFAYRFLYKLRNYAQHAGMPLSQITLRAPLDGESRVQRIDFVLEPANISGDFDWGAKVRADLNGMSGPLYVLPLIDEVMPILGSFSELLFRLELESALLLHGEAEAIVALVDANDGQPALTRFLHHGDSRVTVTPTLIPVDLIRQLGRAAELDDSFDEFRRSEDDIASVRTVPANKATRAGVKIVSTWVHEKGVTEKFTETVNELLRSNDGLTVVIHGLINVSVELVTLAALALNTTRESLLADMLEVPENQG